MKIFYLSILVVLVASLQAMPAEAQQAYGQRGFMPINQANVPGLSVGGLNQFQPQVQNFTTGANNSFGQNSMANSNNQGYTTSDLNTKSPYEQQELALQEAKMLQELQEIKSKKDKEHGFSRDFEQGAVSKSKKGKFMSAMGKMGTLVKKGAEVAAPAGAAVGTLFIMRAAFGPPATFMPIATPTGTAFIPISGR